MASAFGRSPRDLNKELEQNAPGFGFFQAVRLLALIARRRGKRRARLPDKLRFRTAASMSFPASEVTRYKPVDPQASGAAQARDEMTVAFMGLTGPSGVLPPPYTELLISRETVHRDTAFHAFLDLFSHRAIALFYGAWRKYRYWLDVEDGDRNGLTRDLLDFSGVGFQSLREKLGVGETALAENLFAYYAGLLSQKPISAQSMSTVLQGFFGVPVEVVQFVGQWIEVPREEQTWFGGTACELGLSAFAGERIWDRQTKIEIRMGPMRRRQFECLLPGVAGAKTLETLVRFMVGHGLACDVTLILDKRDVPDPRFDLFRHRLLLGGNTWLNTRPPEHDPDDMRYRLLA
jgi:type VI secretion system protein ImpH